MEKNASVVEKGTLIELSRKDRKNLAVAGDCAFMEDDAVFMAVRDIPGLAQAGEFISTRPAVEVEFRPGDWGILRTEGGRKFTAARKPTEAERGITSSDRFYPWLVVALVTHVVRIPGFSLEPTLSREAAGRRK